MKKNLLTAALLLALLSCNDSKKEANMDKHDKGTFGYDLDFLKKNDNNLIVLGGEDQQSIVLVSAKYQGKVFTSTANGKSGKSLGFVGYKAFEAKAHDEHMNAYGGENRFWLGPEGGRYSVYFEKGKRQAFENWHTPKPIDTETWDVVSSDAKQVTMKKEMTVANYQGYDLKLNVDRKVALVENDAIARSLGVTLNKNVNVVAYTTKNKITNLNDFEWTAQTGTICIWMLDMFIPGPNALTIIPFNQGEENELGVTATTDYFGEIPADRLKISDGIVYLKTDGNFRSKLGMNAKRTTAIAANYDPDLKHLVITTYDVDKNAVYLNQEWNPERDPLKGDAMNAYNDGPLEDGSIMGPFFELESVSPAAFLKPNASLNHQHTVYHFMGDEKDLSPVAEKLLGVSIEQIKSVF